MNAKFEPKNCKYCPNTKLFLEISESVDHPNELFYKCYGCGYFKRAEGYLDRQVFERIRDTYRDKNECIVFDKDDCAPF